MLPTEMAAEGVVTSETVPSGQLRVVLRPKAAASLPPAAAAPPPKAAPATPATPAVTAPPPPANTSLPPEVLAARALAEKPKPKDITGPTIFGENLISEKSLDEVILGYLAGNEDEG